VKIEFIWTTPDANPDTKTQIESKIKTDMTFPEYQDKIGKRDLIKIHLSPTYKDPFSVDCLVTDDSDNELFSFSSYGDGVNIGGLRSP